VNVLIGGDSGGGKSTVVATLIEQLVEKDYQFCLIDPEGDFETLDGAVPLGSATDIPAVDEVERVAKQPHHNVIVSLVAAPLEDRPQIFVSLLPKLLELRSKTGRPHWIIVDEAHHVLPAEWQPSALTFPAAFSQILFVTLWPRTLLPAAVRAVDVLVSVGETAVPVLEQFAELSGASLPETIPWNPARGRALVWERREGSIRVLDVKKPKKERQRHRRKYAEGSLSEEQSFFFRGPEQKLNLRAQNLITFVQLARGVDDDTWLYHLERREYSGWIETYIKDKDLAEIVARIESELTLNAAASRERIIRAVEERYTAPASGGG
jgi:hypothetical protein